MLKKILSFVLTVLMVEAALTVTSFAASDMEITFDLTSGGENTVISQVGKEVEVIFSVIRTDTESLYSFTTLGTRIIYDRDFFKYVEGSAVMIDGRKGDVSHGQMTGTNALCIEPTRSYYPTEYYKGRVDFCKFKLEIKDGAEGSSEIKFDETYHEFFDITQNEVIPTCKSLTVTIGTPAQVNFQVGDVITPQDTYVGVTFGEMKPENPIAPAGHKFDGWTCNGVEVTDEYKIVGGETFVAVFTPEYTVEVCRDYMTGYYLVLVNGSDEGYELALPSGNCVTYATPHYNKNTGDNYRAYILSNKALVDSQIIASESEEFTEEMAKVLVTVSNTASESVTVDIAGIDGYYEDAVDIFDATAVQGVLEVSSVVTARTDFVKFVLGADIDASKKITPSDVTAITEHVDFTPAPKK